ncbi:hypothetical protein ACFWP7_35340 [Streptomyces sp. NPDC058470]|uniref:hypothetical protein n=1 Tax=Streptomyces sp. NPDC058470 TaxID=3346515 RepID=UPI00364DF23F
MTTHRETTAASQATDEAEATQRALKAQLFHDARQEPGKPCPCGESTGMHSEACDCEEGAVLVHTMRIADGEDVTEWQDTFRCSFGCIEYTATVSLLDTPWGVRETIDGPHGPRIQTRVFPGIIHGQEEHGIVHPGPC